MNWVEKSKKNAVMLVSIEEILVIECSVALICAQDKCFASCLV